MTNTNTRHTSFSGGILALGLAFSAAACGQVDSGVGAQADGAQYGTAEGRLDPDGEPASDFAVDLSDGRVYISVSDQRGELLTVHASQMNRTNAGPTTNTNSRRLHAAWRVEHAECLRGEDKDCLIDPATLLAQVEDQLPPGSDLKDVLSRIRRDDVVIDGFGVERGQADLALRPDRNAVHRHLRAQKLESVAKKTVASLAGARVAALPRPRDVLSYEVLICLVYEAGCSPISPAPACSSDLTDAKRRVSEIEPGRDLCEVLFEQIHEHY